MNNNNLPPKDLIKVFLAIVIIYMAGSLLLTKASADTFYPAGKVEDCQLASVTALQYRNTPGDIMYNPSQLRGESGNWIQSRTIHDVANVYYPNARRYDGRADRVSVPPGTTVDMGIFFWNYSGHTIRTNKVGSFLSREDPAQGDITRLGAVGSISTPTFNSGRSARTGKYREDNFAMDVGNRIAHNGSVYYSFQTIQPLKLVSKNVTPEETGSGLKLKYEYTFRNTSNYNKCGFRLLENLPDGGSHSQEFCLNGGSEYVYSFEHTISDYSLQMVIPATLVTDPNNYVESVSATYSNQDDINNYGARATLVGRNDSGSGSNWYAWQPSWGQVNSPVMQIEIIPYSFNSPQLQLNFSPKLGISKRLATTQPSIIDLTTGEQIDLEFDIEVKNAGARLENVSVRDLLPDRLLLLSQTDQWQEERLLPGESRLYKLRARFIATSPGSFTLTNTAEVQLTSPVYTDSAQIEQVIVVTDPPPPPPPPVVPPATTPVETKPLVPGGNSNQNPQRLNTGKLKTNSSQLAVTGSRTEPMLAALLLMPIFIATMTKFALNKLKSKRE